MRQDNGIVARYTIERFHDGQINSTRYELADVAQRYFLNNPIMGVGAKKSENIAYMGDNPYEILARDGIIGYIAIYLPLICVIFKKHNKQILLGVIILFAGYMQRPFHLNYIHYLIMLSFCMMSTTQYKNIEKNKL